MAELRELTFEVTDLGDPAVVELNEELQAEYDRRYGGPDETPLVEGQFRAPAGMFLLAKVGGNVVGMGGWRSRDSDAELKKMYVRPSHQRRGVARRLLAELEATALAAGRRRLVLETGNAQPEALALYRSSGYVEIEKFGYYSHTGLSHCLGKALG